MLVLCYLQFILLNVPVKYSLSSADEASADTAARGQPNIDNTKTCCGFCRTGFYFSDWRKYSGFLLCDLGVTVPIIIGKIIESWEGAASHLRYCTLYIVVHF
jgi:hypothetical protein